VLRKKPQDARRVATAIAVTRLAIFFYPLSRFDLLFLVRFSDVDAPKKKEKSFTRDFV
jgi:hypothetical protein